MSFARDGFYSYAQLMAMLESAAFTQSLLLTDEIQAWDRMSYATQQRYISRISCGRTSCTVSPKPRFPWYTLRSTRYRHQLARRNARLRAHQTDTCVHCHYRKSSWIRKYATTHPAPR